ncbi:MAG TPA: choice-of-anchor D domain-containing protein [Vicinamibacterales bacterium]|nr:choice-of-anchor D domain-containing protein [Vicinamibacterales bacterium]
MLPLCAGAAAPARPTDPSGRRRARRDRIRRVAFAALLVGLGLLPIVLEVVHAFELPSGDGASVALLASRKTLDFGARPVGDRTPVVTLAIANNSGSSVPVSKVAITGDHAADFSLVSSTCETLAPNTMCTLVTRFTPKAAGARTARLVVSSAGSAPLEIPLVGNGIDPSERQRTRRTGQRTYR